MNNPTQVSKNQFGEQTNNFIIGGSNKIDCNFVVDHANGNGLGQRSLKGSSLISNVFLHTSATPAAGSPNPAAGYAVVELSEAFLGYIVGVAGAVSPLSGTPINITSGLTIGKAYVIVSVGTSTPANWQALGLPVNQTPNVGSAFIATSASAGVGTGVVEVDAASNFEHVEVVGDPNQTVNPLTGGGYFVVKFVYEGAAAQPNDNTVIAFSTSLDAPTAGPVI
jgi:hypothetical protein